MAVVCTVDRQLVLRYAFDELNLHRVGLDVGNPTLEEIAVQVQAKLKQVVDSL